MSESDRIAKNVKNRHFLTGFEASFSKLLTPPPGRLNLSKLTKTALFCHFVTLATRIFPTHTKGPGRLICRFLTFNDVSVILVVSVFSATFGNNAHETSNRMVLTLLMKLVGTVSTLVNILNSSVPGVPESSLSSYVFTETSIIVQNCSVKQARYDVPH